ncbi:MAG: ice-binding family protein [Roseimicrobium sp.]
MLRKFSIRHRQNAEAGIEQKHSWKHESLKWKTAKEGVQETHKPNHKMSTITQKFACGQKQGRLSINTQALAVAAGAVFAFLAMTTAGASGATTVDLRTAGNYAILSSAGITTTAGTTIVGDIGVSPIASTAVTGFGLILDLSGEFSTSSAVTGKVYAANYASPTPTLLGTAIGDMHTAYTDAAGRSGPDVLNLASGNLNGQTLAPGLYNWGSAVTITGGVTIDGGGDSNAVWIFQIQNRLSVANGAIISLSGGAQAQNIFWQTGEGATLGTNSDFAGIVLTATDIAVQTGASVNGNLYAQTSVTLQSNAITQAAPEPSTVALLVGGVGMIFALRRRPRSYLEGSRTRLP